MKLGGGAKKAKKLFILKYKKIKNEFILGTWIQTFKTIAYISPLLSPSLNVGIDTAFIYNRASVTQGNIPYVYVKKYSNISFFLTHIYINRV